jgi:four helix bundle protein
MGDSHPFAVTFRGDNPGANQRTGVYEQALELTELVDRIVEGTEARFHHKDLLDRSATMVALRIAQAAGETSKTERRSQYRVARRAATDCAAVLDILTRRRGARPGDADLVAPARAMIQTLVAQLAHLAVS